MKTVYFILGMHRSGTSAITGSLSLTGMDVGSNLLPPSDHNKKGYFENKSVLIFNEKILHENNSDWDDCIFDIDVISKNDFVTYVNKAKKIIKSEYKFTKNILIKDPRNCLLFPIWEQACIELKYNIKIVIPYRSPLEVAESLKKRNDFQYEKSLSMWLHHFLSAEMYSRKYERMFSFYDDLLYDTKSSISKIENFLNEKISASIKTKIKNFLQVSQKNNDIPIKNISNQIPDYFKSLIQIIENKTFEDSKLYDKIRKEFYYNLQLFHYKEIKESLLQVKLLNENKTNLDANILELEKNQELSTAHIENIENQNKTLKESIKDYKLSINKSETEKNQTNERLNAMVLENQDIVSKHEACQASNIELSKVNQNQFKEIEQLKTKFANDEKNHKLTKNHIANLEEQISKLKQSTKVLNASLQKEQFASQNIQAQFESVKLKNNDLEVALSDKESSYEAEISRLNNEYKTLENEYKTLENEYNTLGHENKTLENGINKLESDHLHQISLSDEKNKYLTQALKDKEKDISIANDNSLVQFAELKNIHDSEVHELNDLHLKTINDIGLQITRIKATAVHSVNVYSESWIRKAQHDDSLSANAIKNLQLFYNLNVRYFNKNSKKRGQLLQKLNNNVSWFKRVVSPKKFIDLINQISSLDNEMKNIEMRMNRLPWSFIQKFDEGSYLEMNPDISEQVEKGEFVSGLEHFLFFGFDEVKAKGRRISPHVVEYVAQANLKSSENTDYDFLKYLENCYNNIAVTVHNPVIGAIEEFENLAKLSTIKQTHKLLALEALSEPINHVIDAPREIEEPKENIQNKYTYIEPKINDLILSKIENFNKKPLISILMPVYNVDPKWLELAIQSVKNQWYDNWELCIVDDCSDHKPTIDYLKGLKNKKIKIHFSKTNGNISVASNTAILMSKGDYIALMDNDDELTPDALYEVVQVINESNAEFIYSDEDKLEMDGSFCNPHHKADYSEDMFLSQNYLSHLGVIKAELIKEVQGFTKGLEGAQDYDLYLKILEITNNIVHIPKVLYHWRMIPGSTAAVFSDKSYAQDAGVNALSNAFKRRKIDAQVANAKYPGTYKVNYKIKSNPLVSIIIPFKDMPELLTMCIESIVEKSTYENFEIIGISNNSEEEITFEEMKRLKKLDKRINFYEYNVPFNYSKINNFAVKKYSKGEHILLLNNDIEIITPEWIEEMLMHSQRESIGCVGAKLYYPNDTIQHAGVIVGIGGVAGHSHKYFDRNHPGYFTRLDITQNLSAVTAACLMVKKSIFEEVSGLNEEKLEIAFNDIDFCLRVIEKGYSNLFTPYCEAYHHESISRGHEDTKEKQIRFNKEVQYMLSRHKEILKKGDPYYNKNLTLKHENFELE